MVDFGNLGKWVDFTKQYGLGQAIDVLGTAYQLPEFGISEVAAQGPTVNTMNYRYGNDSLFSGGPNPYANQAQQNQVPSKMPGSIPTGTQTTGGGGGGGGNGAMTPDQALNAGLDINELRKRGLLIESAPSGPSAEYLRAQQIRSDISSGYDQYFSQLDQMIGNIPGQRAGQEQIVSNNYNQSLSDLNAQKQTSLADLGTSRSKNQEQQVRSLQDIAANIRNLFQAGNIMLGTKGAGDSSAANQYSYAVTKLGSKQRGDVIAQTRSIENDIADREAKLNTIVTQEQGRLKTEQDNNILQIAQYFQDAQNRLLEAKAQGQLQKGRSLAQLSTQLLQNAQAALMQADANFKNQQNVLLQWAANNATSINQLKSNLAAVGQYNVPAVNAQAVSGTPQFDAQGNLTSRFWSTNTQEKEPKNLYGIGNYLT